MRILHTSDWHIGRRFERESLEADQRAFLEWLTSQVAEHGVDLVIVAGDVYDRSLPAEDAVALLDDALDAIRGAGATVALIAGNHDSARRLGFGARRQAMGGVRVFADDQRPPVPWVFSSGEERVAVVAVPYLDPLTTPSPTPAADSSLRLRTHANVLADALDAGRAAMGELGPLPSIAVLHAFVSGALPSDSEKALAVGGADAVPAELLGGFDYVALGHLHRPQSIRPPSIGGQPADGRSAAVRSGGVRSAAVRSGGGTGLMAYSGSPLPYSFSEDHPKSVRLVEVSGGAVRAVEELPIPVGRPVVTVEATLDELLRDPAYDRFAGHWVAARLADHTVQVQPMERLRARFPHAVSVRYARAAPPGALGTAGGPERRGPRPVEEVVLDFVAEQCGRAPSQRERAVVVSAVGAAGAVGEVGEAEPDRCAEVPAGAGA